MKYTIKEVADYFDISPHTIRYYEKEGLLPFVSRNKSGIREFTESDVKIFATICCLKDTKMTIKEIREYIDLVMEGASSVEQRKELLLAHRKNVLQQMKVLKDSLKQIDSKLEIYQSPDATKIINEQIKYISKEKDSHGLLSAFDTDAN